MSMDIRQYNQIQIINNIQNRNQFLDSHPVQIHLLMIDKCNAKCTMCGGNYFASKSGKRISLDDYIKIAQNIEFEYVSAICLAGAGDPLLNPDIVPIIEYTNKHYPHIAVNITTNGIGLTKKLTDGILENNVSSINISINAATKETFKKIMQVDGFDTVCSNARYLMERIRAKGRGPALQFSFIASRTNIEELPALIELTKDIGGQSVNVMYCRFYPERIRSQGCVKDEDRLRNEESLFYDQELSDAVMIKSDELAARLGVQLMHEPLFKDKAAPQPCTWTYTQLMVGFTGEIYPCGGAEVHFKDKVECGHYNFGNAITEPLEKFWNNDHYRALRQSSAQCGDFLMPECKNCANLMSPNDIRSHIMQWDEAECVWQGEELHASGDTVGAMQAFEEAIRINPGYVDAYNNLGVVYWQSGDNQMALENFIKAIRLKPEEPDSYLNMGELLASLGKIDEARDVYNLYLAAHPGSAPVHQALATLGRSAQPETPSQPQAVMRVEIEAPMVSVIVPTYNRPDMLRDTITSILNQSFQDFEIVVVNDCGQEVESIITELNEGNDKIVYIRHNRNRYLAAARNTGIMAARGKYIAYLDDDDIYYPDHLETLVNFLENSEYRIAYTDAHRSIMQKKDGHYVESKKDQPYSFDFDYDRIMWDNFVPVLCFMHEKACLEETGLFDEKLHTLEDWDLWIRFSRVFKLAHIKKITSQFSWRMDGSTMTSTQLPKFYESTKRIVSKYEHLVADRPDLASKQQELLQGRQRALQAQEKNEKSMVSIIILCWNQLEYTRMCLESIEIHTKSPYELIMVDNGSSDGTRAFLEEYAASHENVQLVLNDENLGFAAGNNQGIAMATGDFVLFLNNDVVVTPGWLERMKHHMLRPDVGMVGPMSNYVAGSQQVSVPYADNLEKMQVFAQDFADAHAGEATIILRLVGFCLLVKKDVLDIIGGFDPDYAIGNFEDDDICLRSVIAGYVHIRADDVFVHHFGSMTFKGNSINYAATMKTNRQYFAQKWKDVIELNENGYQLKITKEQHLKKLLEWGEQSFSQGILDRAVKIFERVLHLDKTNSQALSNLGVIQWQLEDTQAALDTFHTALLLNPKDSDALANLVQAVTQTGRYDLIRPELLEVLKQVQGENPDLKTLLSACQHA